MNELRLKIPANRSSAWWSPARAFFHSLAALALALRLSAQAQDFSITSLTASHAVVVDVNAVVGDDRGGIAVSGSQVFLSGDIATGRFNRDTLGGGTRVGALHDGLVANLRTATVYLLGNGGTPLPGGGGTLTSLIQMDGATGAATTNVIVLSTNVPLTGSSSSVGIFSGWDRVVVHNGARAYRISLPSGTVTDLGAMGIPVRTASESWAYWGVAENVGPDTFITYVKDSTTIARTKVPAGPTTTIATFLNLNDMASFTVSVSQNRWYFHHESSSQFGGSGEVLGYADATFVAPVTAPDIVTQPVSQSVFVGESAFFSVAANGTQPLAYQWFKNGLPIAGATATTLSIGSAALGDASNYSVRVTNSAGSVTSSVAALNITAIDADFFKIVRLTASNSVIIDPSSIVGDDRGGLVATDQKILLRGDDSLGRFNFDLTGGIRVGTNTVITCVFSTFDSIASDLCVPTAYVLAEGTNYLCIFGGTVDALIELRGSNGVPSGKVITLSTPISVPGLGLYTSSVGIFSGWGRIVLHNGSHAYSINTANGLVTDLGAMASPVHTASESWAYWGVAEYWGGHHYMVYARDAQSIVRTRIPDGTTTVVSSFDNLNDLASFTVIPRLNRWYFHNETVNQFSSDSNYGKEVLGYADAAFLYATPQPGIAITQVCPTNPALPGGLLTYSGTVSNAGNITLSNVIVLNNLSGGTPVFTAVTLAPGAVASFTGSYLMPANCSVPSILTATAIAHGVCGCGVAVTNTATATCPILATPAIVVTQTCPTAAVLPGGLLTYDGTVRNAGNVTLTNVLVVSDRPSANTVIFTVASLAPGAVANFTSSVTVPTNACAVTTTFRGTGQDVCTLNPVTNLVSTTCTVTTAPAIAVTLACPAVPPAPGGLISYTGTVRNTGNSLLTNVVVLNNLSGTTPVFTAATLAPGAVAGFTGSYLAPASCSISSVLTGTGRSVCGVAVTNTASATCPVLGMPAIVVTQSCPNTAVLPGSLLTYSGTVRNAGNVTLTNIVVVNNQPAPNTVVFTLPMLAPGATTNFTGSYQTPDDCCVVSSTVRASGRDCVGVTVTDTATRTCTLLTLPRLVVTKTCPPGVLQPGDRLTYSGTVSNAGSIALINVTVVNNQPGGAPPLLGPLTLAPGEAFNYTASYVVPADFCGTDTVTARGQDICTFLPVVSSATTTCPVITSPPRLAVTKNCPVVPVPLGGLFTYTGSVSNAGNVTLVNVFVVDNQPAPNTPVIGPLRLAPGASVNFSGSYLAPTDCCEIVDTVTARGQDVCSGSNVTATATAFCPLRSAPGLVVVPNCPPAPIPIGSEYRFSGYVTNTGNAVLTNVFVFGPQGSNSPVLGPIELAPGEAEFYSGTYTVSSDTCSVPVTVRGQDGLCGTNVVTNTATCHVATPPPGVVMALMSNGVVSLTFHTENGRTHIVQYKSKLSDPTWTDLKTVVGTGGNLPITDPTAAQQPRRFYRIIATP